MANEKFTIDDSNIQGKATMIWNVISLLREPFKPHEYELIILPMTITKRFNNISVTHSSSRAGNLGEGLRENDRHQLL